MKFEHFALNVEDPKAMADWYVAQLGLSIVRQMQDSPFTTFLADNSSNIMLELYKNPAAEIPPYRSMHPLMVHLAFVSEDPAKDRERLLQAGATLDTEQHLEDGSHLLMLRDPWGFALQFCKRSTPMLSQQL